MVGMLPIQNHFLIMSHINAIVELLNDRLHLLRLDQVLILLGLALYLLSASVSLTGSGVYLAWHSSLSSECFCVFEWMRC